MRDKEKMRANIVIAIERFTWSCLFAISALGFYGLSKLLNNEHLLLAILIGICAIIAVITFSSSVMALFLGVDAYPGSAAFYRCPKCGRGINLWRINALKSFQCPRCKTRMDPFGGIFKDKKLKTFGSNLNL